VKLVKLGAFVAKAMQREDYLESLLRQTFTDSLVDGTVSFHIWWVIGNAEFVADSDCKQQLVDYISNSKLLASVNRLILTLVMNDRLQTEIRVTKEHPNTVSDHHGCLDSSSLYHFAVSELGREYSESFSKLYKYCTLGIFDGSPVSDPQNNPPLLPKTLGESNTPNIRKIRPVTEVSGAEFESKQLQKQLRRWFWWMYPGLKDAIESICTFMVMNAEPESEHEAKGPSRMAMVAKLKMCIPALTPVIWTCVDDNHSRSRLHSLLEQLAEELLDRLSSPTTVEFEGDT
jgi:hypothetical protein